MRRAASQVPERGPWEASTAAAYCEQVGRYRQLEPNTGDMRAL
jgi:hypothetical protein